MAYSKPHLYKWNGKWYCKTKYNRTTCLIVGQGTKEAAYKQLEKVYPGATHDWNKKRSKVTGRARR